MKLRFACVVAGFVWFMLSLAAQTAGISSASAQLPPPLIQFSNVATDEGGNTLSGVVNITFSLYSAQQGGEALWTETQNNIQLDATGHYSVQLGITKPNGVPTTLFTLGQARWLGVQIAQQPEQARVLLVSVPYALKAGDAATIGGLPPSAFVLAAPANEAVAAYGADSATAASIPAAGVPANGGVTGAGTVDFLPMWDTTSDIINSVVFQSGSGSSAKIGINTTTPGATLDVKGAANVEGLLTLPATGTATASGGKNSQPQNLVASAFSSTTSTAVNQTFQWQAEPADNDTVSPSGTLNLLFGEGATKPSETGLKVASNGQITFAAGQLFPGTGTGDGSVTSVASGAGLTGGPITGSGTLSIATAGVTNAMLGHSSLTVKAGTDLTGGGTVSLGGTTTLNLDTTKIPTLSGSDKFTGPVTIANTTTITGSNSNGVLQVTNTATSGSNPAIVGTTDSTGASGVKGVVVTTTGVNAGVLGITSSTAGYGVEGQSPFVGVYGNNTATSGSSEGVYGLSASADGYGVLGQAPFTGVGGTSSATTGAGFGVAGAANSPSAFGVYGVGPNYGVYGNGYATSGTTYGVYGQSSGDSGYGVYGVSPNVGVYGSSAGVSSTGVWGDTGGTSGNIAVLGTAADNIAGYFTNASESSPALFAENFNTAGNEPVFEAVGSDSGSCIIDVNGNLTCTGTVKGAVAADGGKRKVAVYAMQSPENWFEDFGSGTLRSGAATVALDPTFAQTVNTGIEYHVFLTPNGDSKGLYVSQKTATSFEVREQGGGMSNIAFDYRIVAKRTGYENVRLADLTEQFNRQEAQRKKMRRPVRPTAGTPSGQAVALPPMAAAVQPASSLSR